MAEFSAVNEDNPAEEKPLAEFVKDDRWRSLPPGASRWRLPDITPAAAVLIGFPVLAWRFTWYAVAYLVGAARTSLQTGWEDGRGPVQGPLFDEDGNAIQTEQEGGA
jgi:hypothetical protein